MSFQAQKTTILTHEEGSPSFVEVRCPGDKQHGIFTKCGRFLGGIPSFMASTTVFKCSCGKLWQVFYAPGISFTFSDITDEDSKKKVPMERKWREVTSESK